MRDIIKLTAFTCIVTTLTLVGITNLHAQHFRSNIFKELLPSKFNPDSTLYFIKNKYSDAKKLKDTTNIIKCLISSSSLNRIHLKFTEAFEQAGEAVFLAEEFNNALLSAKAHEEFAVLYFNFKQNEVARAHLLKCLEHYKKAIKQEKVTESELFHPYYYMSMLLRRIKEMEEGKNFMDSCKSIFETTNIEKINQVYLNNEKAEYFIWNKKLSESQEVLIESANILKQLSTDKPEAQSHKQFLIVIYNTLARVHRLKKEFTIAKLYYQKALGRDVYSDELIFFNAFVRTNYASLLFELGEFKEAYENNEQTRLIHDKYLNPRRNNAQGFLSVKNNYRDALSKKDKEITNKTLQLTQKNQEVLRFRIIMYVLLFLLILVGLGFAWRIMHIKHEKKQQLSAELLAHKNKELTANMLQLIEKEEIISTLSTHLKESDSSKKSHPYLASIQKQSQSLWEEFNSRFVEQNEDFYDRLQKKVPNLTPSELKLCALLKLNFSGKEMAYLLGMTMNSVHVARHRLRKKMNLDRDKNLTGFINSI